MQLMGTSMLLAAAAAFTALPAAAGDTQSKQADDKSMHRQDTKAAVVGEVVDTRNVTVKGTAGNDHQLYKLRTAGGRTVVIDVGQVQGQSPLQKGDMAMAIGTKARINGQPVLFARYYGESHAGGNNAPDENR